MAEMSPLRRRMIEDMTVRNLSPTTQASYIHAVKKFSLFHRRSPVDLGIELPGGIRLHVERGVDAASLRLVLSVLGSVR